MHSLLSVVRHSALLGCLSDVRYSALLGCLSDVRYSALLGCLSDVRYNALLGCLSVVRYSAFPYCFPDVRFKLTLFSHSHEMGCVPGRALSHPPSGGKRLGHPFKKKKRQEKERKKERKKNDLQNSMIVLASSLFPRHLKSHLSVCGRNTDLGRAGE